MAAWDQHIKIHGKSSTHAFEVSILDGALDLIGRAKGPWTC